MSSDELSFTDLDRAEAGDPLDSDFEEEQDASPTAGGVSAIQDPRLSAEWGGDSNEQPLEDRPEIDACRELLEGLSGIELDHDDPYRWVAAARKALNYIDDLEETAQAGPDPIEDDVTTLQRYANIPTDERKELLSTAEHVAATIYDNWSELAWPMGDHDNRRYGIDTVTKANVKHAPSRIKVELKKLADIELQSNEIYRAMQAAAKLSGGEETTDQAGRTHITGGDFEFHEQPTADNSRNKRILYRRSDE